MMMTTIPILTELARIDEVGRGTLRIARGIYRSEVIEIVVRSAVHTGRADVDYSEESGLMSVQLPHGSPEERRQSLGEFLNAILESRRPGHG